LISFWTLEDIKRLSIKLKKVDVRKIEFTFTQGIKVLVKILVQFNQPSFSSILIALKKNK